MATKIGDLLFDVRARTTQFGRDLGGAERMARRSARNIKGSFTDADLSGLSKQVKASSQAMLALGGDAVKGFGQASSAIRNLTGAFLVGGGMGVAATGLGIAIGKIAEEVQKTRASAAQLDAMNAKWGVTRDRVESVRTALRAYGVDVDSVAAQSIVKLGREAKLTEPEIAGLGRRIREVMDLEGVDAETAAKKAISEIKTEAREAIEALEKAIAAQKQVSRGGVLDTADKGLAANARDRADAEREMLRLYPQLKAAEDELARMRAARAQRLQGGDEAGVSAFRISEQRAEVDRLSQAYRLAEERLRGVGDEHERIASLEKEWSGNDSRERLAAFSRGIARVTQQLREQRAEEAKRLAEVRSSNHFDILIKRAELLGQTEDAIREKRNKALAELDRPETKRQFASDDLKERREQINAEADKEIEKLHKERARSIKDFDLQMEAERAKATKTRVDDLEAELARETESVTRAVEDQVLAYEEGERRKQALVDAYRLQVGAAASEEAAKRQKDIDRAILKKDKIKERATVAGIEAGAAFAQGLKASIQSGDPSAAIGSLLRGIGAILTASGNPIAGAGIGAFGGFFADGGEIVGPGGGKSDSIVARVSAGEYIQPTESVQKFGVRFMDRLREGVLDLGALPRFAAGGIVGVPSASPAGATAMTTWQVVAFDPRSFAQVYGQTVAPTQYRRGVSRADAKEIAGMRRRVRAPRSGMQR